MAENDPRIIVRRFIEEIWNTGDTAAADALAAPGYAVHAPPLELRGLAQFKDWLTTARATLADARWTIEDMAAEGDRVAVRLSLTATFARDVGTIAAGGQQVSVAEQHFFRLANGLLAEQWASQDTLRLLEQLGPIPESVRRMTQRAPHEPGLRQAGSERFDKFTERARRVLTLAQEEAARLNHNYIGTEHLLLGLLREGEGVAALVLRTLGVDLEQARERVESLIGRGDHAVAGMIGLTPRSKRVIELAVDEARRLRHHYIGTEHLLLGLAREGQGLAAGVLESFGVTLDALRAYTIKALADSSRSSEHGRPSDVDNAPGEGQ